MKEKIKKNYVLGKMYVLFMMPIYWILDHVVKTRQKYVVFCSFSGRQISDSPKAIYDYMQNNNDFNEFKFFWFVDNPKNFNFPNVIKIGSFKYYIKLFQAKYWVSNASIERLVPYKGKHIYINTWHGIPLKKLGPDEKKLGYLVDNWYRNVDFDLLTVCSEYDNRIFSNIFPSTKNRLMVDLPRNEQLIKSNNKLLKEKIVKDLNIDKHKPILLYAPTFREYKENTIDSNIDEILEKLLPKYNVLVRGHYFSKIKLNNKLHDVSKYKDINDLLIVSDILLTDYSSVLFDYSLLNKPICLYIYDWNKYKNYRGFYLNPTELKIPYFFDSKKLLNYLIFDDNKDCSDTHLLNDEYHLKVNSLSTIGNYILSN